MQLLCQVHYLNTNATVARCLYLPAAVYNDILYYVCAIYIMNFVLYRRLGGAGAGAGAGAEQVDSVVPCCNAQGPYVLVIQYCCKHCSID